MEKRNTNDISETILNRKGANKAADIPDEVMFYLHTGAIESVNLTEWLAVDHTILLQHILPKMGLQDEAVHIFAELDNAGVKTGRKAIQVIGKKMLEILQKQDESHTSKLFFTLAAHLSDSVRCWAAYVIGLDETLSIKEKLSQIKSLAADHHFGVREIAWMAVRPSLSNDLEASIDLLKTWVDDDNEYIRRFAIEAIRPRGVWCKHIEQLKQHPSLAVVLLEHVKSDPSKYVQDSVGNWLNDASKSKPEWVIKLCDDWQQASQTKETKRIIAKAKRTIMKNK